MNEEHQRDRDIHISRMEAQVENLNENLTMLKQDLKDTREELTNSFRSEMKDMRNDVNSAIKELSKNLEDHRILSASRDARLDNIFQTLSSHRAHLEHHDDELNSLNAKITRLIIYAALSAGGVTFGVDKILSLIK